MLLPANQPHGGSDLYQNEHFTALLEVGREKSRHCAQKIRNGTIKMTRTNRAIKQNTANTDEHEQWDYEFTQRLRTCTKIVGSGEALAKLASIPRRTLETYLSGRAEPKVSRLLAIAKAANVSVEWLATGKKLLDSPEVTEEAYYVHLPAHDHLPIKTKEIRDGMQTTVSPPQPPISFDLTWLKQEFGAAPDDLCAVVLGSEAMDPTLRPSNIVLADRRKPSGPLQEGLYLLDYGSGMIVRRLQRVPRDEIILSCDNPAYENIRLSNTEFNEKVEVIGRVIWFGRKP